MIERFKQNGQAVKVMRMDAVLRMSIRYERHSHIVMGEGCYYIATPNAATQLEQAGYQIIGFCGKLY